MDYERAKETLAKENGLKEKTEKEKVADEVTAYLYAIITSSANALVEMSGGIQTLPSKLQNKSQSEILQWVKSAIEEGGEEVLQGVISELNEKLMYDSKKSWGQVFDPARMGEEFLIGTAVGGIAGGGQVALSSSSTAKYVKLGKTARADGITKDIISYARKSADESVRNIALEAKGRKISNKNLGILYSYTIRDVDAAFNSVNDVDGVNNVLRELMTENQNYAISNIVLSRYINRMDTIDPKAQSGYNNNTNVNQNNGGNEDVKTSDQGRFGENGNRSNQSDQGSRTNIKEHRPESQGSFIRRTRNETRNGRQNLVEFSGDKTFAYFPAEPDGSQAYRATEYLNGIGVKAIYCDGIMESNDGTTTSTHPEAVTAPDGTIYISNQSGLVAKAIVSHEAVHHNQRKNSKAFREYSAVIKENLLIENKSFKEFAELVFKKHFDVDYQSNSESKKLLRAFGNELLAYVHEYITVDKRFAFDKFSSMFTNWDAVVEASRRFNEAIGLDFSEETSPTPQDDNGESVFNISARGDRKDAVTRSIEKVTGHYSLNEHQKLLYEVGAQFGAKVRFDNLDYVVEKEVKVRGTDGRMQTVIKKITVSPEGQFDPNTNTITLNTSVKPYHRPVEYILKHEMTHSLEVDPESYNLFAKEVLGSEEFLRYAASKINPETEEAFGSADAWMQYIIKSYADKGASLGEGTEAQYKAKCEMVANFVGDMLFGGRGNISAGLMAEISTEAKTGLVGWIQRFFEKVKQIFKGRPELTEIERLEQEFLKAARSVSKRNQNPAENTVDSQSKKSYSFYDEHATNIAIWSNSAGTKNGDVKIFKIRNGFALLEATDDGYIELARGNYKEVKAEYERAYKNANNEIYGNFESYGAAKGRDIWNLQSNDNRGNALGNNAKTKSQGLQADATGNNENLRRGNKGKQNVKYSLPEVNIEKLTESQYNNFGWVRANDVLTAAEYNALMSNYTGHKHKDDYFPVTRFGETVLHSSQYTDVLMYVKGSINNPHITKIVRINYYDTSEIKKEVLHNERRHLPTPYKSVESFFGEEILTISKARDYDSYREIKSRFKRGSGEKSSSAGRTKQERGRGFAENSSASGENADVTGTVLLTTFAFECTMFLR